MASWRDYARSESDGPDDRANSAISAKSPDLVGLDGAIGTNGTNGTALPGKVIAGLRRLSTMGVPKGVDPLAWRLAVNDTLALASAGFAVQALDLGWSMLDLFRGKSRP